MENQRWTVLGVLVLAILGAGWIARPQPAKYQAFVADGALFRVNLETGLVDIARPGTLKRAQWIDLVQTDAEERETFKKTFGTPPTDAQPDR
jgi:Mg2+ and Co2+ transporter CorA